MKKFCSPEISGFIEKRASEKSTDLVVDIKLRVCLKYLETKSFEVCIISSSKRPLLDLSEYSDDTSDELYSSDDDDH